MSSTKAPMTDKGKNVTGVALVTGAAGFVGRNTVVSLLQCGYHVRAIDLPSVDLSSALGGLSKNSNLSSISRDILSIDATDGVFKGVDFIIHCAGMVDYQRATELPHKCMETNLMTLIRVLEGARLHGVRKVVNMSSSAVYGSAEGRIPEDQPLIPINPYGLSKVLGENAALHWDRVFGVPTISLRLFNTYGQDSSFGVIKKGLELKSKSQALHITGDGSQKRDFLYVTDVVNAAIKAAESDKRGEIYNVGFGIPQSLRYVAKLIGTKVKYVEERERDAGVICANIGKITTDLGWMPRISIERGIQLTLDKEREQRTGKVALQSGRTGVSRMMSRLQREAAKERVMNVLLIGPQSKKEAAERSFMAPPLGVARLAGYLRKRGHYAEAFDPNLYLLTNDGLSLASKFEEREWDVVGFSVLEETLVQDMTNMQTLHALQPDALIVAGGIEAQFNYQTILDKSPAQACILSEGEVPLSMICDGEPLYDIPGVVWKNKAQPLSQELFNEATETIEWEMNAYEDYWDYYLAKYGDKATEENLQEIHTARVFSRNRCPIGCKFCSSTNQITWGTEGPVPVISATEENLVEVIKRIKKSHPRVKTIYLTDDDFVINKRSVIRFCQKVIEEDFEDLSFMCFARATDLSEEVCKWMSKAGFRRLNVGIESFSEKVLEEMNKRCDVQDNHDALERVKRYGIRAFMNVILITPGTNLDDLEATVENAITYASDPFFHAGITLAVKPLKGTEFFETCTDFLSAVESVPNTKYKIKRDDMILAKDPIVRYVQLKYWYNIDEHIEDKVAQADVRHNVASNLALFKLNYMKSLILEARSLMASGHTMKVEDLTSGPSAEPHWERQTIDIHESVGGISHLSSENEKRAVHGSF